MARTKKQILGEKISKLVGAANEVEIKTVDFSDPNRPKTALEIDFPILPVNQVASIEGNAGKPIYQMSKWWARRPSSVFRSLLIAASMKAPEDPIDAAKSVWDVYYANHQKRGALKHLKVADIFMGGGTTLVEGSRLGMQMIGNDLNPVAWFVVKNELTQVKAEEIIKFANYIEETIKPHIIPYYATNCPRGHTGKWLKFYEKDVPVKPYFDDQTIGEPSEKELKIFSEKMSTFVGWKKWYEDRGYKFKLMGEDFNPLNLSVEERSFYRYWGPEIIYTFWAKHGPCQATGCGHFTPIMTTPVVSVKELSVKTWKGYCCEKCGSIFDVEQKEARMAPGFPLVISESEGQFVIPDCNGTFCCPNCEQRANISTFQNKAPTTKKISLTLLLHPEWMKGCNISSGGSVTDSVEETAVWNKVRASTLRFIEVRGVLPEEVTCPETGATFNTDRRGGNVPKKSTFICQADSCGREQDVLTAIKASGKSGPVAMYAQQGYCPECDNDNIPYGGRFFSAPVDTESFDKANIEWNLRKDNDLNKYWPKSELPYGFMTHMLNGGIPNHGFTHWWKMFNPKQLLVLSQLLKGINESSVDPDVKEVVLGSFQQYLRNQNMFCIWDIGYDKLVPHFSNNNFHPKSTMIENSVFSELGRGNWSSCIESAIDGVKWARQPFELISNQYINSIDHNLSAEIPGKSIKLILNDHICEPAELYNQSSSSLDNINNESIDLVVTDPPFAGLLHYSELSDFFYVWLRLVLKDKYPEQFSSEYTMKSLEAVSNKARHGEDADTFYKKILTECWKEANRILKPGGILAFTFHHSEDEPWVAVLESLFDAGFYLEATYPIRGDESKGENAEFGSKTIEYDIIHVCRKRTEEPEAISWARLRRQMLKDIRQLQSVLENHLQSGLTDSDLQVVKRGKALEYFSKHYGKVFVGNGREFTVREALIGINQLLNDESDSNIEPPPFEAEVLTRQFLRIFNKTVSIQRNEMQNYLRGTGVSSSEFEDKKWCKETNRIFEMISPLEFAIEWKNRTRKNEATDLDQALFLVGASYENSGINVIGELEKPEFKVHPSVMSLLDWFKRNGGNSEIRSAAIKAHRIYASWIERHPDRAPKQLDLFDLD